MKKLLKNIILFLSPILTILILLPVDKRAQYQGLKEDCFNHGIWIYDRIFNNSKPIDIAFLGSSHTINGINDKLISEEINVGQAVNLGYCRLGRNLHYILLKELISEKKVKTVILEVRENENRYSHPIFPYLSQSKDVLIPNPFFNRDMFNDIWTHLVYKIELFQDKLFQHDTPAPIMTNDFGFASSHDTAAIELLDEIKKIRSIPKIPLNKIERSFHGNYARVYLKKIKKLCNENHIELLFVYLPCYGITSGKPAEFELYSKYGKVLIPPKEILDKQEYWHDDNHFNQAGAKSLSHWIAHQINLYFK